MPTTRVYSPEGQVRDSDGTLRWSRIIRKTFRQQNVTVGADAVKLPTSPLAGRVYLLIVNNSTGGQILYIGDSSVTTSNGVPVYPRQGIEIPIEDGVDVYSVSSAAGADIRISEGS